MHFLPDIQRRQHLSPTFPRFQPFNVYPSNHPNSNYQQSLELFKTENLVLWARPEIIGSAFGQICLWFQVFRLRRTGGGEAASLIEEET